ncbi:MAG: hypothetical protein R6X16_10670 [Anaerolineae bacterium]
MPTNLWYNEIELPFYGSVVDLSLAEARRYASWYHEQTPVRIAILEAAVRSTPGYEDWRADGTPDSLRVLGKWFSERVERRELTEQEIANARIKAGERFAACVETWVLTRRTLSLAYDIGMYLGAVMVRAMPHLRWTLVEKGKRNADYHQPVLVASGYPVPMNPVTLVRVLASGIADGTWGVKRLYELYDIWLDQLKPVTPGESADAPRCKEE